MNCRTHLPRLFLLAGLLAALVCPPAQARTNCDPDKSTLDKIEKLTAKGQFDDALNRLGAMPQSAQQDFRFRYVKGKALYLKAALTDPNRWNPPLPLSPTMSQGLQILVATAARLPSLDPTCAVQINAYSILNTIGAFYLNRGYFKDAQSYLLLAYANDSKIVKPDTKRKVRDNLGTVFLVQREPDLAIRYYKEALALHSTVASTQIVKALAIKSARVPPMIMK